MPTSDMGEVVRRIRRAVLREGPERTDGQPPEAFILRRDGAALEAFVRRLSLVGHENLVGRPNRRERGGSRRLGAWKQAHAAAVKALIAAGKEKYSSGFRSPARRPLVRIARPR